MVSTAIKELPKQLAGRTEILSLTNGFNIMEKSVIVDLHTAYQQLSGKGQLRYTKAEKDGMQVSLTSHVLVCPHCGKYKPFYRHFMKPVMVKPQISKLCIERWTSRQLSFLEPEESQAQVLFLNRPEWEIEKFRCKSCGHISKPSDKKETIRLDYQELGLEVSTVIHDMEEFSALIWADLLSDIPVFPMLEVLSLDLDKGQIFLRLESDGTCVINLDLSESVVQAEGAKFAQLVKSQRLLRRRIKQFYEKFWDNGLPFCDDEIKLQRIWELTKFIGYPRAFYDAIPYLMGHDEPDDTFIDVSHRLHRANEAISLLQTSILSSKKSLRKIIYANPGLLFYLNELEILYSVFKDVNLFCRLIEHLDVFHLLAVLHAYPGIQVFIRDYFEICKCKPLFILKSFCDRNSCFYFDALLYTLANDDQKKRERKLWCLKTNYSYDEDESFSVIDTPNSTPFRNESQLPLVSRVGTFRFEMLRSRKECYQVGKDLQNCLRSYYQNTCVLFAVYLGNRPIAAIEVNKNIIVEASCKRNWPVIEYPTLFSAISAWAKRYQLQLPYEYLSCLQRFNFGFVQGI